MKRIIFAVALLMGSASFSQSGLLNCKAMVESTTALYHEQKTGEKTQYAIATLGAVTKIKNGVSGAVSVFRNDSSMVMYFAEAKYYRETCLVFRVSAYPLK